MKTNAIIRIIIWSLVIVILIGMLGVGIYRPGRRYRSETPATEPALILNEAPAIPVNMDYLNLEATVTATAVNVRTAPSSSSTVLDMLEEHETIIIGRLDNTEEGEWAWICSPITGWVQTEYLQFERVSESVITDVTNPTVWDKSPVTCDETATVTVAGLNVRSAPATESSVVGMLEKGDVVRINRGVSVNDKLWLGIYNPIPGWIAAEYVDNIEEVIFHSDPDLRAGIVDGIQEVTGRQAIASNTLPVYSAPNTDSTTLQALDKGTAVTFSRQETIADMGWTYITFPTTGWVPTDLLEEEASASASASTSDLTFDPRQIREIDIEWVAGTITIESAAVDTIQVTESDPAEAKYAMVWKQTNDKLVIRFCENAKLDFNFGITFNDVIHKDLTILVPMGWECDSLEVDAASASLEVYNLTVKEVDYDGASGICSFANCVIDELDVDTASGDISFFGSLNILDCDAASASVNAVFENVPKRIDMDSMSGDLDITLPSSAGFTVSMDALSSDFYSDFGYSQNKNGYYRGNGECKITLDAMSGDLYIRELKEANAAPEATAATEVPEMTEVVPTE